MKHPATVAVILSMSLCAGAYAFTAPADVESSRATVLAQAPEADDSFQYITGEMTTDGPGLPDDERVRIAILLILLQIGIVSTAQDLIEYWRHRTQGFRTRGVRTNESATWLMVDTRHERLLSAAHDARAAQHGTGDCALTERDREAMRREERIVRIIAACGLAVLGSVVLAFVLIDRASQVVPADVPAVTSKISVRAMQHAADPLANVSRAWAALADVDGAMAAACGKRTT